jgi:hypothetical protein
MPNTPEIPRPSQLWKQLPPERRQIAAEAFWKDEHAAVEQAEAITAIAQRIKFRPKSVAALPLAKKARYLAGMSGLSEPVAARLLVSYHLDQHRPMMAAFLDAVGIAHDDGLIKDEHLQPPPRERLAEAARAIAAMYPAADVAVYLSTLIWQDPETWGALAELPEAHPAARQAS